MCFEWFPGRFPSEIQAERDRLPEGFMDEMIESFSYAKAFAANQADSKSWQSSPMRITAMEIEHAIAAEDIANG